MHCCYSRKKRARARERESVSGEESEINRKHHRRDRYRNRVIRPSLSFWGRKKAKKKSSKTKRKLPIDQAKDDDVNKNDLRKRTCGRKASER